MGNKTSGMTKAGILAVMALALGYGLEASAVTITFNDPNHKVISINAEARSGLDKIYVAYDSTDITDMSIAGGSNTMTVMRYGNLGGGYGVDVPLRWDGSTAHVDNIEGNCGYIVTDNGRNTCVWLVDYHTQPMTLTSVSAAAQQECNDTHLNIVGSAASIHYYTIDGRPMELSRDIEVSFYTDIWEEKSLSYSRNIVTKTFPHLTNPLVLTPPLYCATEVTVSGDRFLKEWGMGITETSQTIQANGLEVHTYAEQTNIPEPDESGSNIINGGNDDALGGSAPAIIRFTAYPTEGIIHNEWQISRDPEFSVTEFRFNEQEVEYSFEEEGLFYVRYIGSNSDGSCETYGDVYTVSIGASDLRIPNVFTPNGDGVNDVWKVGYRSLLNFKCWIFDRYGNEIYHFEDPSAGWDGKYNGKIVKPGVYYYVIEAKGSDGKKYKKGGDINILNYKPYDSNNPRD